MRVVVAASFALCAVACSSPHREHPADAVGALPDGPGFDAAPDAPPEPFDGVVYAHSMFKLYKVDPDTLQVTLIGPFIWPRGYESELMTDIAVDKDENIVGISYGAVYSIDKHTAECKLLTPLTGDQFNGLSFVPKGSQEILVATGIGGSLWQIDVTGGSPPFQIGDYGGQVESSGDLVSIVGFGTVATVKNGSEIDYLARIDETTGEATMIGSTGYPDIWGIGFWRNKVFGFVATNQFVLIDVATGHATYISTGPENWAGAGVTTHAPITPI
jgi:hypothetical protein